MLSRINKIIPSLMLGVLLASCGKSNIDTSDDFLIGGKVENISSLNKANGQDKDHVVIFDETTRRIHQFDLNEMKFQKSYLVRDPAEKHYVLSDDNANYVVDMTLKKISIFSNNGMIQNDPLKFQGTPKSVAYQSNLGLMVTYDNLGTVGLLKLDTNTGQVTKSWLGGTLVDGENSIASGDLLANGKLVLSMTNSSFCVVDTAATLDQKKWVQTSISHSLGLIKWLSPIRGSDNLILVLASSSVALFDLSSGSITESMTIPQNYFVQKISKSVDAHVLLKSNYESDGQELKMIYVYQGHLKTRSLIKNTNNILLSKLDVQNDLWTILDSQSKNETYINWYNDPNEIKELREVKQYRLSDLAAVNQLKAPSKAQIDLTSQFMFILYPIKLGSAERINLESQEKKQVQLFNRDLLRDEDK